MKPSLYFKICICAIGMALSLSSCNDSDKLNIEALPFQSKEDGSWKLVMTDGKEIEDIDFKNAPTMMSEGRYWVMNSKGYYELYSKDSPTPIVDEEYRYVSLFRNGKAIVAKRDEDVTIIDRKGNTVTDLSKIGKYVPDQFSGFNGELAVFTYKEKMGVCNVKGELILKPVYSTISEPSCGKIVALDSIAFNSMMEGDSVPRGAAYVYNYKGEELLKIPRKKYKYIESQFYGDYIAVGKDSGDKGEYDEDLSMYGILNVKGEEVVKPSKKYRMIGEISGENFSYYDGEKWGVQSIKGEKILPAKYASISFAEDFIIATAISDDGNNEMDYDVEDMETRLYDKKGQPVIQKKYLQMLVYGRHIFAQVESDRWVVLTLKGEPIKEMPKISNLMYWDNLGVAVSTDKIDIDKFVKDLDFNATSMDGITFSSGVKSVLNRQAEYYSWGNSPKAADYNYTKEVSIYRRLDGASFMETVVFPTTLSHQNYRSEQVIDFWIGYTYYYHINKVPTGYTFTDSKPQYFSMTFDNYGIMRGKLKTLYKALCKRFEEYGTEQDHNGAATLFALPGGKYAVVAIEPHNVVAMWGNLPSDQKNLYKYYGNKEDLSVIDEEGDI